MSAIWGAISLDGSVLTPSITTNMRHLYSKYAIDRFEEHAEPTAIFACGIQYFTPESQHEELPLVNEQYLFTADVLLDNREELMTRLGMDETNDTIPDGTILCEMYARFGEDCLNDLLGAYAFVYYDRQKKRLDLVSDSTGNRCLYYRIDDNVLYFSTLSTPLAQSVGYDGINGRWINDFLALDSFGVYTSYEETPFSGILKVLPREIVTLQNETLQKRLYWQPDIALLHLDNDADYAEQLKSLFTKSVECTLRADKTGIMLSGGLDSSAVACYAAPILRDREQCLYTYTSVPVEGYISTHSKHRIADESEDVFKTKAFLESKGCTLESKLIKLDSVDIWESHAEIMQVLEMPYKSLQNILWSIKGQRMAAEDGVRVLLNGGFGNVSISLDNIDNFFNELLHNKSFITYLRQIYAFGRAYKLGKRGTISRAISIASEYYFSSTRRDSCDGSTILKNSYISAASLEKYNTKPRFSDIEWVNNKQMKNYDSYREAALVNDHLFCLKGEVTTKFSLLTGVLVRDPTMDKRLIEFCVRLPANQCSRDGISRRLVRAYLSSDMPSHIIDAKKRGLQSADFLQNIRSNWTGLQSDLHHIYQEHFDNPFVDCERALADLEKMENEFDNIRDFDIYRLGYTAMALEFIDIHSEANANNNL